MNPSRKDRRKAAISLSEAIDREVAVVLSLQHAINVPLRERTEVAREEEDEDEDDLGAKLALPMIPFKLVYNLMFIFIITCRSILSLFNVRGDGVWKQEHFKLNC